MCLTTGTGEQPQSVRDRAPGADGFKVGAGENCADRQSHLQQPFEGLLSAGTMSGLGVDVVQEQAQEQGEGSRSRAGVAPVEAIVGVLGSQPDLPVAGTDPDRFVQDDLSEWTGGREPLGDGSGQSTVGLTEDRGVGLRAISA